MIETSWRGVTTRKYGGPKRTGMKNVEYYFNKLDPKLKRSLNGSMIGVRMAMFGCRVVDIDPAKGEDRKKLFVFVETNRRVADSIALVTGCTAGNRRLRIIDNGILAASFVNVKSGAAARIIGKMGPDEIASFSPMFGTLEATLKSLSDGDLFNADMSIKIDVGFYDMPGPPKKKILCDSCGVRVLDNRQVQVDSRLMCKPCSGDVYWTPSAAT